MQRFDFLFVLVERRVRVDFDFDFAVGVFLGKLFELQCAFTLWRIIGDDMAELDDDWALSLHRGGDHQNDGSNARE